MSDYYEIRDSNGEKHCIFADKINDRRDGYVCFSLAGKDVGSFYLSVYYKKITDAETNYELNKVMSQYEKRTKDLAKGARNA